MARISQLLILMLVLGVGVAAAQSVVDNSQMIVVTGQVVDAENNEPLIGASVMLKGTRQGVPTDIDGKYTIKVPRGSTLVVTYVGYHDIEVPVDETTKIIRPVPAKSTSGCVNCDGNSKTADETHPNASPIKVE